MKLLQWISTSLFLLFFVSIAGAQCPGPAGVQITAMRPVSGAPFSADLINETNRILHDGTHIHQEMHAKVYRDSEGRSRCDVEKAATGKVSWIIISDPVARLTIRLDLEKKTATVTHLPQTPQSITAPPLQNTANKPSGKTDTLDGKHTEHTEQDLGSQVIEGFTVAGRRFSNTTAAGQVGNDKPITSVMEDWFSNDLKIILLSKHDDPRLGTMADKVVNIHAGNPDPALFQMPEGYTVKNLYCHENACIYDSE